MLKYPGCVIRRYSLLQDDAHDRHRPSARICHPSGQTFSLLKMVPILILPARDMSHTPFVMFENASHISTAYLAFVITFIQY
jgi:hypothetical protein